MTLWYREYGLYGKQQHIFGEAVAPTLSLCYYVPGS